MSVLRRSGNAVTQYLQCLNWKPQKIWMVGLGVHYHEVYVFNEVWPDVEVVAYEPHPINVREARSDWKATFLRVEAKAISNYVGKGTLHAKSNWKDGGTLLKRDKTHRKDEEIPVQVTTLDSEYWADGRTMGDDLLWLDCEGSELAALQGAEKLFIPHYVRAINIETTASPAGVEWPSPLEVWDFLVPIGFFHAYTHSVRAHIGQADAIYLRHDLFNPRYCINPASIREWKNQYK